MTVFLSWKSGLLATLKQYPTQQVALCCRWPPLLWSKEELISGCVTLTRASKMSAVWQYLSLGNYFWGEALVLPIFNTNRLIKHWHLFSVFVQVLQKVRHELGRVTVITAVPRPHRFGWYPKFWYLNQNQGGKNSGTSLSQTQTNRLQMRPHFYSIKHELYAVLTDSTADVAYEVLVTHYWTWV